MKWKKCKYLIFMAIVFVSPMILTRHSFCSIFDFSKTGEIGDTIGGLTAPVIGLISIYLLVRTLDEQLNFNKLQADLQKDEQFRATLFQLLEEQREIARSLSVSYHSLSSDPTKSVTVNLEGYKFFKAAIYELSAIFLSMESPYNRKYDPNEISDLMNDVFNSLYSGINMPIELQEENKEAINDVKRIALKAYTTDKYNISEQDHQKYQTLSRKEKMEFVYNRFLLKHENCSVYFRHLYHILDFIDRTEKQELEALSDIRVADLITKHCEVKRKFYNYAQFVQAQMSSNELLLLYYNIFSFPKTMELVVKYDILENLMLDSLIKPWHYCIGRIKVKMHPTANFDSEN